MPIETILKRCSPGLVLALVATAGYFQARGAVQLLGMALGRGSVPGVAGYAEARASVSAPKSGQAILERNPFDSVTGPLKSGAALGLRGAPRTNTTNAADPLSWPACEGVQVLIVSESKDPWWSLATVRAPGEPRARLRRVGDGIAGKQVAFIGFNPRQQTPAVWMEGNGALCQALLFGEQPPLTAPSEPERIQRSSDDELNVNHSLVERSLQDPGSLGAVRVVPERKDGALVGLRLFGIRPGSLLGALGLRNGDRLESINGFQIARPEQALQAYARLSTAKRLNVRVSRGGRPLEITLNIG